MLRIEARQRLHSLAYTGRLPRGVIKLRPRKDRALKKSFTRVRLKKGLERNKKFPEQSRNHKNDRAHSISRRPSSKNRRVSRTRPISAPTPECGRPPKKLK